MQQGIFSRSREHELWTSIFHQGVKDYIKLQHPLRRKKEDLQEALRTAVAMIFWTEDFRFAYFKNGFGEPMSTEEYIQELLGSERYQLKKLQKYVIKEAEKYWRKMKIKVIEVTEVISYKGHVWVASVEEKIDRITLDFDNKLIKLPEAGYEEEQMDYLHALIQIGCYHEELTVKPSTLKRLSEILFELLKMNPEIIKKQEALR